MEAGVRGRGLRCDRRGRLRALRRRPRGRVRGPAAEQVPAGREIRPQRDRDRARRAPQRADDPPRGSDHRARRLRGCSAGPRRLGPGGGGGGCRSTPARTAPGRAAQGMSRRRRRSPPSGDVATNRRARHRFELLDRFECGIELLGTEVKSLREGKAQLGDAYAVIEGGEVWLRNAHIPPYAPASRENHDPERPRKLLLHRYEIERLVGRSQRRGLTLIPIRIYFKRPWAKVELALARGKEQRDRRREIRDRDVRREVEREHRKR